MNDKRKLWIGITLLVTFALVLIGVLGPVWNGRSGLEVSDDLFNSLAKGSTYYIPEQMEKADKWVGDPVSITLKTKSEEEAQLTAKLYQSAGADVKTEGLNIKVDGDLGNIAKACLADADAVFNNRPEAITAKYGADVNDREVIYYWYNSMKQINKQYLAARGAGPRYLFTKAIMEKALEPTYNFYGLKVSTLNSVMGLTVFLLAFYLIYTIWYGFGILYIFEGLGIVAHSGGKHEA